MSRRREVPFVVGQVVGYSRIESVQSIDGRAYRNRYNVTLVCCGKERSMLHESLRKAAVRGQSVCQDCTLRAKNADKTTPTEVVVNGWSWGSLGKLGFRYGGTDTAESRS